MAGSLVLIALEVSSTLAAKAAEIMSAGLPKPHPWALAGKQACIHSRSNVGWPRIMSNLVRMCASILSSTDEVIEGHICLNQKGNFCRITHNRYTHLA